MSLREFRKLKERIDTVSRLYSVNIVFFERVDSDFRNIIDETGITLYKKSDVYIALEKFEKAITSLREAVNQSKRDRERDGTIQRFEFTIELLWKTFTVMLLYYGIECNNLRTCIKEAFRNKLIDDDEIILDMIEDRNARSHIYNAITSKEIFERIKNIYIDILENVV